MINYYVTNYELVQNFHFGLSEIEAMLPFERDLYIDLCNQNTEEKNK